VDLEQVVVGLVGPHLGQRPRPADVGHHQRPSPKLPPRSTESWVA
jgi:hypothetical protein